MFINGTDCGHALPLDDIVQKLRELYGDLDGQALLRPLIADAFKGRIAAWSSFGGESAVLLHMVSVIDQAIPVLFVDTGKHFPETLDYRDRLIDHLRLTSVRTIFPDGEGLERSDADGSLWRRNSDMCCDIRKVAPMKENLMSFSALITGRKRYQADTRSALNVIEQESGHIKINPLAGWGEAQIRSYMTRYELPSHPLVRTGYRSIGCAPCTTPVRPGEDPRAGRWRGTDKTECGIHFSNGCAVRLT